jgi:hypothetical protein
MAEEFLLREEHNRCGSAQPAAIRGRATHRDEELDLQPEDHSGAG